MYRIFLIIKRKLLRISNFYFEFDYNFIHKTTYSNTVLKMSYN